MLYLSYIVAALAMLLTAVYLFRRLRLFTTTSTMLLSALLLVYGPASLVFTLSSGENAFLIRYVTGGTSVLPSMFPTLQAKVGDLTLVITSINFSLALMYAGIVLGIAGMDGLFRDRASIMQMALANWSKEKVLDEGRDHHLLLALIATLSVLMLYISATEHHVQTIAHFFSIANDNPARSIYRAQFSGSQSYWYRVVLSAIAPMFCVWGLLAGAKRRSALLLTASGLLMTMTLLGKVETLSKAPPAFFLLQILLALFLTRTNRISLRGALLGGLCFLVIVYVTTRLMIVFPTEGSSIEAVYSRIFEVENETLVENFAVFPQIHPFLWGGNIRPVAALMGIPHTPSFSIVGYIWYNDHNVTSPTLFIADAWADFSYGGVLLFSLLAGAICRSIDLWFLPRGKSVIAIAVLTAAFWGVLTLITTALTTAMVTGGLVLGPALAALVMRFTLGNHNKDQPSL
jgi:hypothetical protein